MWYCDAFDYVIVDGVAQIFNFRFDSQSDNVSLCFAKTKLTLIFNRVKLSNAMVFQFDKDSQTKLKNGAMRWCG